MHLTRIEFTTAKEFAKAYNHLDFLKRLGNPCYIETGDCRSRAPVIITTLLHGNEVSGLKAIHSLLRDDFTFDNPVVFIIASVSAALTEPVFMHRMLKGQVDLNRCFGKTTVATEKPNPQFILAKAISDLIVQYQPKSVVDIHNTSGSGPAFAVIAESSISNSSNTKDDYIDLASHFSERVIVTDICLGALMEMDFNCPIITFEAGGTLDSQSDYHAEQGIINLLNTDKDGNKFGNLDVLSCPRRVMLKQQYTLIYTSELVNDIDLCLRGDIEHFNFAHTPAHTHIGWTNKDIDALLKTDSEAIKASEIFYSENDMLYTKKQIMMFMITTRADIAATDCLFYFVET